MRVTPNTFIRAAQESIQQRNRSMATLQNQITTGLRIHKPSDDPLAFRTLESLRLFETELEDRLNSVTDMESTLNQSVSALVEVNNLVQDVRRITVDARSATNNDERKIYADQIDGLLSRLTHLANTRDDHGYLFSGTSDQTRPFEEQDGEIVYVGSDRNSEVAIESQVRMDFRYSGAEVFGNVGRGETRISGMSGLALGEGATSGRGIVDVQLTHTSTSYDPASGVQPGADSVTGDTVLGDTGVHQLTLVDTSGDGSSGTVQLNDGGIVEFTSADTNLRLVGNNGEIAFLDLSGVTAGFNGTVDLRADGAIDFGDGSPAVAIDFTDSQPVINADGEVTVFDTSGVFETGTSQVQHDGSLDVFSTLISLRDNLLDGTTDKSIPELDAILSFHHDDLQKLSDHTLRVVGDQSTSLESLTYIRQRTENAELETQRMIGDLNNVDMAEAIVNLQNEQNQFEYTLATLPSILDLSLLDYLG